MNAPAENVDAQSWSAQLWADNALLGNCPVGRLAIGIATDICRYRSSGGRRHDGLTGSFDGLATHPCGTLNR